MRRTTVQRAGQAIVTERLLSFLDKFVDAAMIISLILWGPLICFAVGFLLTLVYCLAVLELEIRTGFTGVEHMKVWAFTEDATDGTVQKGLKAIFRLMIRSHLLMLVIGSVAYLEADYVTLLLKKPGETRRSIFVRVMLPSVTWGITAWTLIYWGSFTFATTLWVRLVGCTPIECLTREEWRPVLNALQCIEGGLRALAEFFVTTIG